MTDAVVTAVLEGIEAKKRKKAKARWYVFRTVMLQLAAITAMAMLNAFALMLMRGWLGNDAGPFVYSVILFGILGNIVMLKIATARVKHFKKIEGDTND